MQSKTLALLALSATATVASPFHRRADFAHHPKFHHGTGTHHHHPTGSGSPFLPGNSTDGLFPPTEPTGAMATSVLTVTVSPLPASSSTKPANFGNAAATGVEAASSSCTTTSIATEYSTHVVTVTASDAAGAKTQVASAQNSVSAGAFYGAGNWGHSSSQAPGVSPSGFAPTGASTTFATVPSASKSGATGSSAPSATGSVPSTGSGGKRGISFNDAKLVSAFGNAVSWCYNWGATASGTPSGVEFVPMMWGKDNVGKFASQVGSATHVLSFNEPDLGAQSNLDPQTAAQLHKQGVQSLVGKVQIGSPAVTNGGGSMGVNWLDSFFQACGKDCPVNFVAYHWYGSPGDIKGFQSHTDAVVQVAQKYGINRVWLTEFKPDSGDDASQASFMKQAVSYLDGNAAIERYAAFMASDGTLLSGGKLNPIGSAYAGAS